MATNSATPKKKEFRLPKIEEVPVVEVEVKNYGTIIIERDAINRAGGSATKVLAAHNIKSTDIVGIQQATRTREYLNNLPEVSGAYS